MPLADIELEQLVIQLRGPMQIGTGMARGLIQRTVVRGHDGLVYVPGSTLKGKVRAACEALARLSNLGDCQAPHPQAMAQHRHDCIVCRLFGAPALPATLRWHSATLTEEWARALRPFPDTRGVFGQTQARTQVQLNRARGLAAQARLFTSEFAMEGLTFIAQPALTGRVQLTPASGADEPSVYHELILLTAALKMVDGLGGSQSRGAGQCQIGLPANIHVDHQQVPIEPQLKNIEWLQFYPDDLEALREH